MCKRTGLWAAAMLGLGTLLGFLAARGQLPWAPAQAAGQPSPQLTGSPNPAVPGLGLPATPQKRGPQFAGGVGGGGTPKPGNARGATTGPTDAPGYDHPNQYVHLKPTQIADNMEPVMVHPKQMQEAMAKLAKAKSKNGK